MTSVASLSDCACSSSRSRRGRGVTSAWNMASRSSGEAGEDEGEEVEEEENTAAVEVWRCCFFDSIKCAGEVSPLSGVFPSFTALWMSAKGQDLPLLENTRSFEAKRSRDSGFRASRAAAADATVAVVDALALAPLLLLLSLLLALLLRDITVEGVQQRMQLQAAGMSKNKKREKAEAKMTQKKKNGKNENKKTLSLFSLFSHQTRLAACGGSHCVAFVLEL